jgi:thiol-disulfide isomerase/thioredoxin
MKMQKKLLVTLLSLVIAGLCVNKGMMKTWAAARGNVVVFSANWCASCREVLPVVREVASQNSMSVTEIDVDAQTAPKQARGLGLSIPSDEPPQVFLVDHGKTTLLYSGKGFKFGYPDAVRATILQNLQKAQP